MKVERLLKLDANVPPTEHIGNIGEVAEPGLHKREPTADDVLGPFYRPGAPYRAKICPALASGVCLLISGRVWAYDNKRPLSANLDIWQANSAGDYDSESRRRRSVSFVNRARCMTDESGHYEFETIHPGSYRLNDGTWRAPHIHFLVSAYGFKTLVTQLFFKGDKYLNTDPFVKKSLIIPIRSPHVQGKKIQRGVFDIVLVRPES
jgi:catechol 1,2-dioxygenase